MKKTTALKQFKNCCCILVLLLLFSTVSFGQITKDTLEINILKEKIDNSSQATLDLINNEIKAKKAIITTKSKEINELQNKKNKTINENNELETLRNELIVEQEKLSNKIEVLQEKINEKLKNIFALDSISKKVLAYNDSISKNNQDKTTINKALSNENKILADSAQKLIQTLEDKTDSIDLIAKVSTKTRPINYVFNYAVQYSKLSDSIKKKCDSVKESLWDNFTTYDTLDNVVANYEGIYIGTWKKTRVLHVKLKISDGLLHEIIVTLSNGEIYRNDNKIINLNKFDEIANKIYLNCKNCYHEKNKTILLSSVIEYEPLSSYKNIAYTNIELFLGGVRGKNTEYLKEGSSLNSYIDVAAFTDIKGLAGEANGLAQISLNSKFITNTKVSGSSTVFGNFIGLTGGFAKFDKDFKGTSYNILDSSVNRKDLFQRSAFNIGVRYNLVNFYQSPKPGNFVNNMQLNFVYKFVGSQILIARKKNPSDLSFDTSYKTVTHNQVSLEPILGLTRNGNFGTSLSIPFHLIWLKRSSYISNYKPETWASPSINVSYFSKRNPASKLFFRYIHWVNLKQKVNSFFQLQLGFSTSIGAISKLQN